MGYLDDVLANSQMGLLNGLPAAWQYDPQARSEAEKRMIALVGGAGQGAAPAPSPLDLGTPQPGSAAFSGGASGIFGTPAPASVDLSRFTPAPLSLGGPPRYPTVAQDQKATSMPQEESGGLLSDAQNSNLNRWLTSFFKAPDAAASSMTSPGAPPQPQYPTIAQDQPTAGPPTIAPPDPRDGQPLTEAERRMMALVQPGTPSHTTTAPAAPQNDRAGPIAVGNYQMPRIGTSAQFTPADDGEEETPAAARPAAGVGGPGAPAAPAASMVDGFGAHLNAGLQSFINTDRGGLFGRLANGIAGTISGQRTDPAGVALQLQGQGDNATAQALRGKGVDPATIQAAILSARAGQPDMLKTLVMQHFGPDKFQHITRKDAFGGEEIGSFDPATGKTTFGRSEGGAAGASPNGILAPGVMKFDPTLQGDAYLAQYSPDVQAMAKAYINGDTITTGNPRLHSIQSIAKQAAIRWGQDTGNPVSDSTYAAKRKMFTDLASSGNSTMGGILSNGESSFKHLAEYTKSAADQGNASHNFWMGGPIAHAQNYLGNAAGGSDVQGKVKAINDNLGKYGAESTKFYAGTGGGVEERLNALKEMNATTTSGEEAAAYAEKEKSLMIDRLNTKFQEIINTLGEERGNAEIAKHMPDIQKNIATIDANIAKLRGQPAPSAAANTVLPPGSYAWTPQSGVVGGGR